MQFEALLREHGSMKVERPPKMWDAETDDGAFVMLLVEIIAAGLAGGGRLSELTLAVANVVVEPYDDDDEGVQVPAPGEYVAVTVSGETDFGPDARWSPGAGSASDLLARLAARLDAAGARWAYVRRTPPTGSLTVFVPRLLTTDTGA